MSKNYNKPSAAQQRMINFIKHTDSLIQACLTEGGGEWYYNFVRKITKSITITISKGKFSKAEDVYESYEQPWPHAQRTIKCMVEQEILVLLMPMSDKEFAIQKALGTIDYKIYTLAEKYE